MGSFSLEVLILVLAEVSGIQYRVEHGQEGGGIKCVRIKTPSVHDLTKFPVDADVNRVRKKKFVCQYVGRATERKDQGLVTWPMGRMCPTHLSGLHLRLFTFKVF